MLPGLAILDADEVRFGLPVYSCRAGRSYGCRRSFNTTSEQSSPACVRSEDHGEHFNGNTDGFQDVPE